MAPKKSKKKQFDSDEEDAALILNMDENGDDLGGLMAQLKAPKKKNKSKKKNLEDEDDAMLAKIDKMDIEEDAPKPKNNTSMFGALESENSPSLQDSDEDVSDKEITIPSPTKKAPAEKKIKEPVEEGETRIKTKKEKEREKKERLKVAKKAAAAEKPKKESATPPRAPSPEPEPIPEQESDNETTKNKKKKKKGLKDEPPKRKGPPVAALREALLARKQAEEEHARLIAEEESRILAEEKAIADEERLKEERKLEKKEKERERIAQLKKEGKYMTPAQKQQAAIAKLKLDALLASGSIKVEGLEKTGEKKKVVYSNKKKRPPPQQKQPAQVEVIENPTEKVEIKVEVVEELFVKSEVDESWNAADKETESEKVASDVPDAWDASGSDADIISKSPKSKKAVIPKAEVKIAPQVKQVEKLPIKKESVKVPAMKEAPTKGTKQVAEKKNAAPIVESSEESSSEDGSDSDDDSEEESEDEELTAVKKMQIKRKEEAAKRREERVTQAMAARSKDDMRSPICCILGHVDTGKTKLLDKIRQTNVQEGEAGGITQQIGATFFPIDAVIEKTQMLRPNKEPHGYNLPGLLVIDTPGHESFTNLRSRGSSLCNIAVLVVDIVHGLEPQTIESLNLLRDRKTPFIVALNKIDRLFDWQANPNFPTRTTLAMQKKHVVKEFNDRVTKTIVEFAEQGLNACLYWDNKNLGKNVSLVPTSAITGEGIPDMLHLLIDLTQTRMTERLMYLSELECTVLEVKVIEGLGTTIDVVLSNGVLNEGDRICVCGLNGPIVTTIRALLTPQPMRELRVKSAYVHHKQVKASLGIKIAAPDLEKAVAGARLMVITADDDEDDIKEVVMGDLQNLLTSIDKSGKGVCVQASTLGSLEALLSFLASSKIPVSGINIGPVHKKDVIRASVMLERAPEYAQLLCFDVPIDKEAEDLANDFGVKIFTANIIYHLFDQYKVYMAHLDEEKRKELTPQVVFPCIIRMVPDAIFNKKSPIIIGADVLEGTLKIGTPLCVTTKEGIITLGKVTSMEINHKARTEVKKGDPSTSVRIECSNFETPKTYGRHFTQDNEIYSRITRQSIDVLKSNFRNDMSRDDWALVVKLKKILKVE